eukprot:225131_1
MFKKLNGYNKKSIAAIYVKIYQWKASVNKKRDVKGSIDFSIINKILIDNDIKIDDEHLRSAFDEYKCDKNKFTSDIIDAFYCTNDELLPESNKISIDHLPNDNEIRHIIYEHILFKYIKKDELNNNNFIKIATTIIRNKYNHINVDEFQKIALDKHVDGRIFVKGSDSFKNSTGFVKLFTSIAGYNKKTLAQIYTKINKWKPIKIQFMKAKLSFENKNNSNENNDENKTEKDQQQIGVYEIGTRFYFWNSLKSHKHYIQPKYQSLKEELLKNTL